MHSDNVCVLLLCRLYGGAVAYDIACVGTVCRDDADRAACGWQSRLWRADR